MEDCCCYCLKKKIKEKLQKVISILNNTQDKTFERDNVSHQSLPDFTHQKALALKEQQTENGSGLSWKTKTVIQIVKTVISVSNMTKTGKLKSPKETLYLGRFVKIIFIYHVFIPILYLLNLNNSFY